MLGYMNLFVYQNIYQSDESLGVTLYQGFEIRALQIESKNVQYLKSNTSCTCLY